MVCPRCISTVQRVLAQAGFPVQEVTLGEAVINEPETSLNFEQINGLLVKEGFELIYDREKQLTEKIKNLLIKFLDQLPAQDATFNTSAYLAENLNMPYPQLSKIFSRQEHTTLEKYFIRLKIEKVKELISYNQLTLSEIAFKLKYSSLQHLSNQFKKITGVSVSDYKQNATSPRTSLDALL